MPRDLTDLMERATSFAPPEPHAAGDITRLAAHRQRRRTTGIAAGLAAAVVVAGAVGYGVTRGHHSAPEPAAPYKYDQHVDASDAVPASTLPGYRLEPWTVPSVQRFGPRTFAWPTYRDVDSDGNLLVWDSPDADPLKLGLRVRLFEGTADPPRALAVPTHPASNDGQPITWMPSFLDEGHLLWTTGPILDSQQTGFHITDLSGGHDEFIPTGFRVGKESLDGKPSDGLPNGIWGDRMWFVVFDHTLPHFGGSARTLYTASFNGHLAEVAENVADLAVGDGRVAWVTTRGRLMTERATGGSPQTVDVPLDPGCRIPIQLMQTFSRMFAVSRSVIALAEECGPEKSATYAVVAFDPSGRRLVRVTGMIPGGVSIVGDSLLYTGGDREAGTLRYDFVTGSLATFGPARKRSSSGAYVDPRGAGDYVLWYDRDGGHVARVPQ